LHAPSALARPHRGELATGLCMPYFPTRCSPSIPLSHRPNHGLSIMAGAPLPVFRCAPGTPCWVKVEVTSPANKPCPCSLLPEILPVPLSAKPMISSRDTYLILPNRLSGFDLVFFFSTGPSPIKPPFQAPRSVFANLAKFISGSFFSRARGWPAPQWQPGVVVHAHPVTA
jgi:hypothetical protein